MHKKQNEPTNKSISPLVASLLMPGLGQAWHGETSKAISLFLAFAFSIPASAWAALHLPAPLLLPCVLMGALFALSIYIVAIFDATRARRSSFSPPSIPVLLALLFSGQFLVLSPLIDATKSRLIEAYRVPSNSMIPNLLPGDWFFVDRRYNRPGAADPVRRGDIVIFVNPNDRTITYVKRVIGLPGDRIEIRGHEVFVNGASTRVGLVADLRTDELNQRLTEEEATSERGEEGRNFVVLWKKTGPAESFATTVPNGSVFLLGDHRDFSQDSRHFGPVPLADVLAKASQVFFSISPEGRVRWIRLGAGF